MLNYLWAGMIIIGIVYGAFTGKMPDITNAALDSAKEAVTLCITMVGVMAFWMGIMEIASRAGIIEMASKKMRPLIRFLFPEYSERASGKSVYYNKLYCKFSGAWLGGNACRTSGNAGAGRIRTGAKDEKSTGKGKKARCCVQ